MQWCICQHCVKDVQIVGELCCKNPSNLPIEKFNGVDCITQLEVFANVCLNNDVLEAEIGAWRDLSVTDIDLSNVNYRFIAYKQYAWWSYGYLDEKKRKPLPNCVVKKIRAVFLEEGHI